MEAALETEGYTVVLRPGLPVQTTAPVEEADPAPHLARLRLLPAVRHLVDFSVTHSMGGIPSSAVGGRNGR